MNVLSLIKKKKEKRDFFLSLLLKPFQVSSILFEEAEGKLSILSTKEEKLSSDIDSLPDSDLVDVSDLVVSFVENSLPSGDLVKKTIFGVPYSWAESGKIKKEHLEKLKKVCDELELVPMGFIVSIEAIVHYLQEKDGAPISCIFVEIAEQKVIVYLVRAGNIVEVREKEVKKDFVTTVEHILKEVDNFEVLPSKIILMDYEGVGSIQQEFLSHPWTRDLPFLHLPQVVVLEKGFENEAIINGVATQMGFEVLDEVKTTHRREVVSEKEEESEIVEPNDFGFMKEENVPLTQKAEQKEETEENDKPSQGEDSQRSNQDLESEFDSDSLEYPLENELPRSKLARHPSESSSSDNLKSFSQANFDDYDESYPATGSKKALGLKGKKYLNSLLPIFKTIFKKSKFKLPSISKKIKFPTKIALPKKGGKLIPIIAVFAVFVIGFSWAYYNVILKADVLLFLDKKTFEKSQDLTLSLSSDTNVNKSILKINPVDVEIQQELKKNATGKKVTGDKAKGDIIIYNKTEQKKNFSKGTVVEDSNGHKFELTNDVNIASTSAFSTSLSSVKASVQALNFGSEYNLPSNTNFTFEDYPTSSFFAKNDTAFSGGSKKELVVISKSDLESLATDIVANSKDKALSDLKAKLDGDKVLLPFILSSEFSDKNYDGKEGDEAQSVKLSANIKFEGGYYSGKEIEDFAKELASGNVPSDFYLDLSKSKTEIKDIKIGKNKNINGTLSVNSVYLPKIDISKLASELTGKDNSSSEKRVKDVKGVVDYKIIFRHKLPIFPDLLPFNSGNINVTTKVNE